MRWLLLAAFIVICVIFAVAIAVSKSINYSIGRRLFLDSDDNLENDKEDLSEFKPFNFGRDNMTK
ncbi:MAG: hypothetical protein K2M82_03760 [Lachnospiraceae bacterium]|nr:hypothetical protein [Lachnospiraceae bacterium]